MPRREATRRPDHPEEPGHDPSGITYQSTVASGSGVMEKPTYRGTVVGGYTMSACPRRQLIWSRKLPLLVERAAGRDSIGDVHGRVVVLANADSRS